MEFKYKINEYNTAIQRLYLKRINPTPHYKIKSEQKSKNVSISPKLSKLNTIFFARNNKAVEQFKA